MSSLRVDRALQIRTPIEKIVDVVRYYSDGRFMFAVFEHGTCVLPHDPKEFEYDSIEKLDQAESSLVKFNVKPMDDGNFIVEFTPHVFGVVFSDEFFPELERIISQVESESQGETIAGLEGAPSEHFYVGLYARTRLAEDKVSKKIFFSETQDRGVGD